MSIVTAPLKRTALALFFAAAATLGATGALPGDARVASFVGMGEPETVLPDCPNTTCDGPNDCTFRSGQKCTLSGTSCTVSNC